MVKMHKFCKRYRKITVRYGVKFIKNFKKFLAFVFSFFIFVPNFNPNVHAVGDINVLIVGDRGVGKSTLLHRIVTQNFENPLKSKEIASYEHGKIYYCERDAGIAVAEINFSDNLAKEYMDYLYQNANIVIHMSDVKSPSTKQEVSNWYDEYVRTILRGVGDPRGSDMSFHTNFEDFGYAMKWFKPLQLQGKIGYIIFVCNKLDTLSTFSSYEQCRELWNFICRCPNSRSIYDFDSLSTNGESDTIYGCKKSLSVVNELIESHSEAASFHLYDENRLKKNFSNPEEATIDLQDKYVQFLEKFPRKSSYGWSTTSEPDEKEFIGFEAFYNFAESYSGSADYRLRLLLLQELHNEFCRKHPEFKEKHDRQTKFYRFVLESEFNQNTTETGSTSGGSKKNEYEWYLFGLISASLIITGTACLVFGNKNQNNDKKCVEENKFL